MTAHDWEVGTDTQFLNQNISWRIDRDEVLLEDSEGWSALLAPEEVLNMICGLSLLYAQMRKVSDGVSDLA